MSNHGNLDEPAIAQRRRFKLRIWGLALGYFAFYAPYSFLIKIITTNSWPGISGSVSGFRMLAPVVISTAIALQLIVTIMGWWKYLPWRKVFGINLPWPGAVVVLSGLGTAIIIATTTLAFTFTGISIVFALLLMRGGVLMMGPAVDLFFRRRVRWFSWIALGLTIPAVLVAILDVSSYRMTPIAALVIAAYLSGYLLRLPCVTKLAKQDDTTITYRYFVQEQMVAAFFLVAIPALLAVFSQGGVMLELRQGFTEFTTSPITLPALLIGALYACLYCFGTLIYLDCRENTFCIPLNRGSSLLAGLLATYALASLFGQRPPSQAQLGSAGMIILALLFLSPLHHFSRTLGQLNQFLIKAYLDLAAVIGIRQPVDSLGGFSPATGLTARTKVDRGAERIFLFVCSGNTCRSPMAAAIANAEIAVRLKIPFAALETVNARALSAGISAREGAPLTPEAQEVLSSLNVPVRPHAARNLTVELADQAEMIFCMTSAHRQAVIAMVPSVDWKTFCLDAEGDIDDPIGHGLSAYVNCARRIQDLVRLRFDSMGLPTEVPG